MLLPGALDLVEVERIALVGHRVVEGDVAIEPCVEAPDPAEERRDPDTACDPDLLLASRAVVEAAEGPRDLCRVARSNLVAELPRVVARPT